MFLPFLVEQVMFKKLLLLVSAGYVQPVSTGSFWRNGSNFSTWMRSNKRDQHVNKKLRHCVQTQMEINRTCLAAKDSR